MDNTYVLILAGVAVALGLGFIVLRRMSGQGAEKQSGD
jgi:LPXTG-motif cell wall-anchored protein